MIAHVRGVPSTTRVTVSDENLHPFLYENTRIAFAHNGQLERFDEMRYDLVKHTRPEWHRRIRGNTDTEWLYAIFLSQLDDPAAALTADTVARAVEATFRIVREVRARLGIATSSAANLFLSDGALVAAVRFAFDFGCYPADGREIREAMLNFMSLWYTCGRTYGSTVASGA